MGARRYELTDFEWSVIESLLPNKPRGVARVDDRKVLNGICWRLRTGSPWADIPERTLYRTRHLVECFINKIKHFRAIAMRFEKHAENCLALIKLAAIRVWLRAYESVS